MVVPPSSELQANLGKHKKKGRHSEKVVSPLVRLVFQIPVVYLVRFLIHRPSFRGFLAELTGKVVVICHKS